MGGANMIVPLENAIPGECVAELATDAISHAHLQAYAAASGDSNPLHLDSDFARHAGFDDVIVHGMFGMAQLARLIEEQLPQARLHHFSARFAAVIPVGYSLHCLAELAERQGNRLTLNLMARLPGSEQAVTHGTAVVTVGDTDADR